MDGRIEWSREGASQLKEEVTKTKVWARKGQESTNGENDWSRRGAETRM